MAAVAAVAGATLTAIATLALVAALVLLTDWRRPRP